MFKSILLPLDNSEWSQHATRYAIRLARHYGASIRGLHVIDLKRVTGPLLQDVALCLGVTPPPDFEATFTDFARNVGETLLSELEAKCADWEIPCVTRLETGIVPDVICREAHTVDLVVLGTRGEHAEWGSRLFGSTCEAILREINKPTFVVGTFRPEMRKVLVAYDGSRHANSVLGVAVEACVEENLPLYLLTVGESPEDAEAVQAEALTYCEPHELEVHPIVAVGDAPEAILANADRIEADVIAMGAYGHSRLRELIVGSTTELVLRKANCPVLIYR